MYHKTNFITSPILQFVKMQKVSPWCILRSSRLGFRPLHHTAAEAGAFVSVKEKQIIRTHPQQETGSDHMDLASCYKKAFPPKAFRLP